MAFWLTVAVRVEGRAGMAGDVPEAVEAAGVFAAVDMVLAVVEEMVLVADERGAGLAEC